MPPPQKKRSPHAGVVLLPPRAEHRQPNWRARWADPDSGKTITRTLPTGDARTLEKRRKWAIDLAKALRNRRSELEAGRPRAVGSELETTLESYYAAHPQLRDKTLQAYQGATDKLIVWASDNGITSVDDVNRARLLEFRASLIAEPRRKAKAGGKRGALKAEAARRSPHSVNRELRAVGTVLRYLCDADKLPRLTHDDLRRALKRLDAPIERIEFLKPAELQKLLEAALRHDAEPYVETRAEHAGKRPKGTTARYDAIAPLVATALLTGMRFGEVIDLQWEQVDLNALDSEGQKVGEIHLSGATKTKRARTVGLDVSPALRQILAAMKLRSGDEDRVFNFTADVAIAAGKRLKKYGAPKRFGWQMLRRTCGTFLTNAPGIFQGASAYRSAKQLGHSVVVAERHYVDVARGIPRDAKTLEAAMQITEQVQAIAKAAGHVEYDGGGRVVPLRETQRKRGEAAKV